MHKLRVFFLYFVVLLTLTQCGNPLNAALEKTPLTPSTGDLSAVEIPKIIDGKYSARILVTNLIKDRNITGISTAKTTYPSPVLETGKPIKPGHEKSAWVEFDPNDVSFIFDFEDITAPSNTESETFDRALRLYKDGFTNIYLYRTTGGAISISPDPNPDDKSPDTPSPTHDPVKDSYIDVYNLTKLVPINTVTFNKTTDPEPLGPIQPKAEAITSVENGMVQIAIDYGNPVKLFKTIAALPGTVTNVYFYKAKDGTFKAEDALPTADKLFNEGSLTLPGEGNISNDNTPQKVLPDNIRDQLGLLIIKNITRIKNITSVSFTKGEKILNMIPGPLAGSEKSITLEPGDWNITVTYAGGSKSVAKTIVRAGIANFINYLYFYKPLSGDYTVSSDDLGPEHEDPPKVIDPNDWQNTPPSGSDVFTGEGQVSNEDGSIAVPDTYKDDYGVVQIHNLTVARNITSITFTKGTSVYPASTMAITHGHSKSIVLSKGIWKVNVTYSDGTTSSSITGFDKTVKPYGFTQYINHIYFYKTFDTPPKYDVKFDDDKPEDGSINNTDDTGSNPNDSILGKGLLVIYNDSDVNISVSHANIPLTAIGSKAHKEFWLGSAAYQILATYSGTGSPKDGYVAVLPNMVNYLYFKGTVPNYSFNTIVTPDVDTASGSEYDKLIKLGNIAVINKSSSTISSISVSRSPSGDLVESVSPSTVVDSTWTSKGIDAGNYTVKINDVLLTEAPFAVGEKQLRVFVWEGATIPTTPGSSGPADKFGYINIVNNSDSITITEVQVDDKAVEIGSNKLTVSPLSQRKILLTANKTYAVTIVPGSLSSKTKTFTVDDINIENFIYPFSTEYVEPDGKGFLKIINAGPVNNLSKVEIKNQGPSNLLTTTGNIPAKGDAVADLIPGYYTITPFVKVGAAEKRSMAVFTDIQIVNGLTTTIVYEDSLEYSSQPQVGITGDLWVQNKSQYQVNEIVILDPITNILDADNNPLPKPVEIIRKQMVIQPNNSEHLTVPYGTYLARVYTNERGISFIEAAIKLDLSNRIFTLVIDDDSEKVISGGASGGSGIDPDKSGLRIYNSYSGPLPFKIFEVFLYEGTVKTDGTIDYFHRPIVGPGAKTADGFWDGKNLGDDAVPGGPAWDFTKDAYLTKGQFTDYKALKKDTYYRIVAVAGSANYSSYPITYNASTIITRDDITYFVGDFWLSAGALKIVRFDPYNVAKNDPDAPLGSVTIRLSHAGSAIGLAGSIVRVQFIDGKNKSKLRDSIPRRDIVLSYESTIEPTKEIGIVLLPLAYRIRLDAVDTATWNSHGAADLDTNSSGSSFVPSNLDGSFPVVPNASDLGSWIYFDTSHHANQDFFMAWVNPNIVIKTDDIPLPTVAITKFDLSGVISDPVNGENPHTAEKYYKPKIVWGSPEQYSVEMYAPVTSGQFWQYNSSTSWLTDTQDSLNGGADILNSSLYDFNVSTRLYQVNLKIVPKPGYSLPDDNVWKFTPNAESDYAGKDVTILYFPSSGVIKIRWPKLP